jgi:salicylate hydroxylase
VAASRNVVIAGAGIGGLTAALMLAQSGFRITLLEQAAQLSEAGAGIQLSPNATRILIALGLGDRLRADAFVPQAVAVKSSSGGRLARVPLGDGIEKRFGAPYWTIHRADLQAALLEAAQLNPDIVIKLGTRVEDFTLHSNGLSIACRQGSFTADEHGVALIGADGLWSAMRTRLGQYEPDFRKRTAWRTLIPIEAIEDEEFRTPEVQLWLGRRAHLVHYPVKGGKLINVVAIVNDRWSQPGWVADGAREELLSHFSRWSWAQPVLDFLSIPERWSKWALYDHPSFDQWSKGPVTLLGDAAHPMLPFLAQGAAMAIEDATVLADSMSRLPNDIPLAMRRYEAARRRRTARVQRAARRNGRIYHLTAGEAVARNLFLRLAGGKMLLRRYNWLYDWRMLPPGSAEHPASLPHDPEDNERSED